MRTVNPLLKFVAIGLGSLCLAGVLGLAAASVMGDDADDATPASDGETGPPPVVADVVVPAYSGPPLSDDELVALFPEVADSTGTVGTVGENRRIGVRSFVPSAEAAALLDGSPAVAPAGPDASVEVGPDDLLDAVRDRLDGLEDGESVVVEPDGRQASFVDSCAIPGERGAAEPAEPAEPVEPAPAPDPCAGVAGTVVLDDDEALPSIVVHGVELATEPTPVCSDGEIDDDHHGVVVFTAQPIALRGIASPRGVDGAELGEPIEMEATTAVDQEPFAVDRGVLAGAEASGVVDAYPTCVVVGPIPVEAFELSVRMGLGADGALVRGIAETLRLPVGRGAETLDLPTGFLENLRDVLRGERRVVVAPDPAGNLRVDVDAGNDEVVESVLWARDPADLGTSRCGTAEQATDGPPVEGRTVPQGLRLSDYDRTLRMTHPGDAFAAGTEADVCITVRTDATPPSVVAEYAVPVTTATPVLHRIQINHFFGEDPDLAPMLFGVIASTADGGCGDVYRVDEVRGRAGVDSGFVPVCDLAFRGEELTLSVFSAGSEQRAPAHMQTVVLREDDCPCWNTVIADVPGVDVDTPYANLLITVVQERGDPGPGWAIGSVETRDDLVPSDAPALRISEVSVSTTGPEPWLDPAVAPDTRAEATLTYQTDRPAEVEVIAHHVRPFDGGCPLSVVMDGVPDGADPTRGTATFTTLCLGATYHFEVRVIDPDTGTVRAYSQDRTAHREAETFHLWPSRSTVRTGRLEIPLHTELDTVNLGRGVIASFIGLITPDNPWMLEFQQGIGGTIRGGVTCASGNDFYDDEDDGTLAFGNLVEFEMVFEAFHWVSGNPIIDCPAPTDSLSVRDAVFTRLTADRTMVLDELVSALAAGPVELVLQYPVDGRDLPEDRRRMSIVTIEHAGRAAGG